MNSITDFVGLVKGRQREIADALAAGNARDYAMYQLLVGEVAGLEKALTILESLLNEEEAQKSRY